MLVLLDLVRILSYKRCTESNPQKLYTIHYTHTLQVVFFLSNRTGLSNAKVNLSLTFFVRFTTVVFDQRGRFRPISLKLIEIIYENASEFQPVN